MRFLIQRIIFLQVFLFYFSNVILANSLFDITAPYRIPDPGAAPSISNQFSNLPPISKEVLFSEFKRRVDQFESELQKEVESSHKQFTQSSTELQKTFDRLKLKMTSHLEQISEDSAEIRTSLKDRESVLASNPTLKIIQNSWDQKSFQRWVRQRYQNTLNANQDSRLLLKVPAISNQLDSETEQQIMDLIRESDFAAESAFQASKTRSVSETIVRFVATYAEETAGSIRDQLTSLKNGFKRSFQKQIKFIDSVLFQPDRLNRLSIALSKIYENFDEFQHLLQTALVEHQVKMMIALRVLDSPTAIRLDALDNAGEMAGDLILGLAVTKATSALGTSLKQIGSTLAKSEAISTIGEGVLEQFHGNANFRSSLNLADETARGVIDSAEQVFGFNKDSVSNFLSIVRNEVGAIGPDMPNTIKKIRNASIWTDTKYRTSVENAFKHWKDHRGDFPNLNNALEYVEEANNFINNPPPGTLAKTRMRDGSQVFYHPESNTFAIKDRSGAARTMYKPNPAKHGKTTNMEYYDAQ